MTDEWAMAGKHRWMLDKLLLADHLGYNCGPAGTPVSKRGEYVVRPCVNLLGMARGAFTVALEEDTDHLPAGTFWCERFEGRHLSIDYDADGEPVLIVEAVHAPDRLHALGKPDCWRLVEADLAPELWVPGRDEPAGMSEHNIEYIGGNPIEINFRHNQDFRWGNTVAWPVFTSTIENGPQWREMPPADGLRFVEDPDHDRLGFWIDA